MTKEDQLTLTIQSLSIILHSSNIYAPNSDTLAFPFFESTFKEFGKIPNKTKIIPRDINVVLNADNDKLGGNSELHQMPRNIILNNIENFNLTNIWCHLHPQYKQFMYLKLKPQKGFSWLDYFLISDDLISLIESSTIISGFKTDHSVLNLHFTLRARLKGQDIGDLTKHY